MKFKTTLFSKHPATSTLMIALLGTVLSLSSCKTDVAAPEEIAALSVVNAAPTLPSIDFVIEGTKVNNTALLFGQKVEYVGAYPGKRTASVYTAGTAKSVYTGNFSLTARLYHSLYVLSAGDTASYLLVQDQYKAPAADKAQLRFANLSSDSPAYSLELEGDTTAFADRSYRALTPFKYVKPAIYKLLLRNTSTNAVVASMENVEFKANKYYTVWAKGLQTTTVEAQKLGIKVSEHYFN